MQTIANTRRGSTGALSLVNGQHVPVVERRTACAAAIDSRSRGEAFRRTEHSATPAVSSSGRSRIVMMPLFRPPRLHDPQDVEQALLAVVAQAHELSPRGMSPAKRAARAAAIVAAPLIVAPRPALSASSTCCDRAASAPPRFAEPAGLEVIAGANVHDSRNRSVLRLAVTSVSIRPARDGEEAGRH